MKIKCSNCNGTGREKCEVHGSHICERCHGSGCINDFIPIGPCPIRDPIPSPWRSWKDKWIVWY